MGQCLRRLCPTKEEDIDQQESVLDQPLLLEPSGLNDDPMQEQPVVSAVEFLKVHTEELEYKPVGKFDSGDPPLTEFRSTLQRYLARVLAFNMESSEQSKQTGSTNQTRTVLSEVKLLSRLLPCQYTNSIFAAVDEQNMSRMEAIIIGTEGTPYQHGVFLFSIELSLDYPNSPPHVQLLTTGGGRLRFNPNLYESGYVCLSLLGTWRGEEKQNWQPNKSNIAQVLLSIQTLVMNEDVYYNEPGYEDIDRTQATPYNRAYQNIVRFGNIAYAMNDVIENPPVRFRQIIMTHFYLKRNRIVQCVEKWIEESKQLVVFYDHSQTHNYQLALRYSENDFNYKNDLITELHRLHKNLSNIRKEDTLISKE